MRMRGLLLYCLSAVGSTAGPLHKLPARKPQLCTPAWPQALAFCLVYGVNGGFVGSVGPSLLQLKASTGLGEASIGLAVMVNRMTKLAGVFAWTAFARRVQAGKAPLAGARILIGISMMVATLCASGLYYARSSGAALQTSLAVAGLCYGISDTALTQLTMWTHPTSREQRTQIALLNAAFTVGCALAPAVIALSLRLGGSCYASFGALSLLSAIAAVVLFATPLAIDEVPPPLSPTKPYADEELEELPLVALKVKARRPERPYIAERARAHVVIGAMCAVLFCVTGCEHAVGTWLAAFGAHVGGLGAPTMAVMSSAYWGAICAGRVGWAVLSTVISSGWPVLTTDSSLMLLAALFFIRFASPVGQSSAPTLWTGTLLLALGFASSLPCALTLPTEARVEITPARLLALNLAGSAGEMLCPFLLGIAFERGQYSAGWAMGWPGCSSYF